MTISPDFSSITAVLFDWDFTLAYSLGLGVSHVARTTVLFQNYGVNCTEADLAAAQASLAADIANGTVAGSLRPQEKQQIIRLYQELLQRLGHPDSSYEFAYEVYVGYALLPHSLFADVSPTLQKLQERNLELGVLSNHSSSVLSTIDELLGDIIPHERVTVSEDIGVHKPQKTSFRRAAAKLRQDPANCLYVGDNLQVDAIAAVQQGGFAAGVWIDRSDNETVITLPKNVYRLTNLTQLILFF
ncbi:MAG: HAD family hydrolase [Chloroflexi bacterium]|nr:HAD family hydrolase [Chloroflexota bacterium]